MAEFSEPTVAAAVQIETVTTQVSIEADSTATHLNESVHMESSSEIHAEINPETNGNDHASGDEQNRRRRASKPPKSFAPTTLTTEIKKKAKKSKSKSKRKKGAVARSPSTTKSSPDIAKRKQKSLAVSTEDLESPASASVRSLKGKDKPESGKKGKAKSFDSKQSKAATPNVKVAQIKSPGQKRTFTPQTVLYEGPFMGLQDETLRKKHLTPVEKMLSEVGVPLDSILGECTVRIKQRNSANNSGMTECDYFLTSHDEWYVSRRHLYRGLGLTKGENGEVLDPLRSKPGKAVKPAAKHEKRPMKPADEPEESAKRKKKQRSKKEADDMSELYAMAQPSMETEAQPTWHPDVHGNTPSKKRQKVLNQHLTSMHNLIERLFRIDGLGMFKGDSSDRRAPSGREANQQQISSLRDIRRKVDTSGYISEGREATLDWIGFQGDVERVVQNTLQFYTEVKEEMVTEEMKAQEIGSRILNTVKEMCAQGSAALKVELDRLRTEEELEWLGSKNQEPAMPRWRKELMNSYQYRKLDTYEPAEGLLPEEKEQLMGKLIDTSRKGNRWVYPEGLEMVDLWSTVVALDKSDLPENEKPLPRESDTLSDDCVVEEHTWGIDCYSRRNIEIVLSKGRVQSSMTLAQIHWFIEFVLLRAINAVRPVEDGWDMSKALRNIVEDTKRKQAVKQLEETNIQKTAVESEPDVADGSKLGNGMAESSESDDNAQQSKAHAATNQQKKKIKNSVALKSTDGADAVLSRELVHRRIKVYWEGDLRWYHGRIIDFREPSDFLVLYDDGQTMWENLGRETFRVIGGNEQKPLYDDSLSSEQIIDACELLLDQYSKRGTRDFMVHSKGIGVVTKVSIEPGRLIQKYVGLLYPCWLWEQKEAKEDDERVNHKRETGEVILPDFWNMRLELPKDEDDEQGIDLLHVDAKTAGNFASRMSHSCRPNCGTMTAVIDGKFCIGMRALRKIEAGEELTIDYNCVTDSLDEYRAAICLCGAHDCRGSFLYITGATQQMQIVDRSHGPLHRVAMLFMACYDTGELERAFGGGFTENWPRWVTADERSASLAAKNVKPVKPVKGGKKKSSATKATASGKKQQETAPAAEEEMEVEKDDTLFKDDPLVQEALNEHGFGKRALVSLPPWALRFAAHILEFIDCEELERARLEYVAKMEAESHSHEEGGSRDPDEFWRIAKLESKGVADQRVTNLVIALDKARHHMCERLSTNLVERPGENLVIDSERTRLRERWWIADRCLARWVGDDADEFPDWYAAIITHVYVEKQELRVVYDTGEINRIPFNMARRPKLTEVSHDFTGCDVMHHQPPFRVLDDELVLYHLWDDQSSGVAARLVKSLVEACNREIPLWQTALEPATKMPYWWNFETRTVSYVRPSAAELAKKTRFIPKVLGQIEKMLVEKKPLNAEGARKCLGMIRDKILTMPVPASERLLEDMHQKAVDLLTMYCVTRNFFLLAEPENESTNNHAVINALTSWIGQGVESRLPDITEMVGTALLPPIERAYDPNCGLGYCGPMRSSLLAHLKQNGMSDWPKNVISMFPHASDLPPQPPDIEKQWPHPVPPVRLFGSPALDSALFDHFDYTKACSAMSAIEKKTGIEPREKLKFENERGAKSMSEVVSLLREKKRNPAKFDPEDLAKVTPPPLPEPINAIWVQCEIPTCGKWRKLPFGFNPKQLPSPFSCADLGEVDPSKSFCDAPEEQETGAVVISGKPDLNPDSVRPGDFIDAFDKSASEWKVASVLETTETAIKLKYVDPSAQIRIEWMEKRPDPANGMAFSPLASLHTYTVAASLKKAKKVLHPYQHISPEADPEVGKVLYNIVHRVERKFLRMRKPPPPASVREFKPRGPRILPDTLAGKLEITQFVPDMPLAQRNGLTTFLLNEREIDPAVPFVTVLARWSVMDQSQRQMWNTKAIPRGFIGAPKVGNSFIGPALMNTGKHTQTTPMQCLTQPDRLSRTFFASFTTAAIGMAVETAYGKGMVTKVVESASVEIKLLWGSKLYIPIREFKAEAPVYASYPLFTQAARPTSAASPAVSLLEKVKKGKKKLPRPERDFIKPKASKATAAAGDEVQSPEEADIDLKGFDMESEEWKALSKQIDQWRPRWKHVRIAENGPFVLEGFAEPKDEAKKEENRDEVEETNNKPEEEPAVGSQEGKNDVQASTTTVSTAETSNGNAPIIAEGSYNGRPIADPPMKRVKLSPPPPTSTTATADSLVSFETPPPPSAPKHVKEVVVPQQSPERRIVAAPLPAPVGVYSPSSSSMSAVERQPVLQQAPKSAFKSPFFTSSVAMSNFATTTTTTKHPRSPSDIGGVAGACIPNGDANSRGREGKQPLSPHVERSTHLSSIMSKVIPSLPLSPVGQRVPPIPVPEPPRPPAQMFPPLFPEASSGPFVPGNRIMPPPPPNQVIMNQARSPTNAGPARLGGKATPKEKLPRIPPSQGMYGRYRDAGPPQEGNGN